MKNLILFVILIFSVTSCTLFTAYETQFIDVDDTLLLKFKMTKSETLEIIGKPTEVVRGILMEDGEQYEIWRYSTKEGRNKTVAQLLPRKPSKNFEIDDWIEDDKNTKAFYVLFKNDRLVRWGDFTFDWCNGYCSFKESSEN